jgi:hypothetical protein
MTHDLESLYQKYASFVACLHTELDRTAGRPVASAYRTPLLSYDDFCHMWREWSQTAGLQDLWQRRFEAGYAAVAAAFRARLEAAIGGGRPCASTPPRAAA